MAIDNQLFKDLEEAIEDFEKIHCEKVTEIILLGENRGIRRIILKED